MVVSFSPESVQRILGRSKASLFDADQEPLKESQELCHARPLSAFKRLIKLLGMAKMMKAMRLVGA
jgi:hypothetical protein